MEQGVLEGGKDTGSLNNGRLHNRSSATFGGERFIGMYKDGKPNGYGEMTYKNTIPGTSAGVEFEVAQYKGNFRSGKRDGQGKMIWADGAVFTGTWKNDERFYGKMILSNGCVYIGGFVNDKFEGDNERLLMPNMLIYQGQFNQGKTCPIGMLLYSNGDIFYG